MTAPFLSPNTERDLFTTYKIIYEDFHHYHHQKLPDLQRAADLKAKGQAMEEQYPEYARHWRDEVRRVLRARAELCASCGGLHRYRAWFRGWRRELRGVLGVEMGMWKS
jgi:hypothetical protein